MISDRIRARKIEWGTKFFHLLGKQTSRYLEYEFARTNLPSSPATLGDVGACGSLFALECAKKGYNTYAIDYKEYPEKHKKLVSVKTDIRKMPIPDKKFDAITCISTIEHIGLNVYGDPEYDEGDILAVRELTRTLKTEGLLIITTPFGEKYHLKKWMGGQERVYDMNRLTQLFKEYKILIESYYIPNKKREWVKATRDEACKVYDVYPQSNLVCLLLKKVN
jgi:2-polyprenyl-3-methyl-5-hydroxy-6-metoxy-1,4-benzoquinol methylase